MAGERSFWLRARSSSPAMTLEQTLQLKLFIKQPITLVNTGMRVWSLMTDSDREFSPETGIDIGFSDVS